MTGSELAFHPHLTAKLITEINAGIITLLASNA
jgi:hypothetical protein